MSLMDSFWAAPPVTRTITAATVAVSLAVYSGILPGMWVIWITELVFTYKTIPQMWRFVSAFLLTGPKLGLILDPFFLYQNSSRLELGSPQFGQPGSYMTYILFIGAFIILTNGVYFQAFSFLSALTIAMAYTFAQDSPNSTVSYIIISFPAKYLPWAMLAIECVLNGPISALQDATGILAAHAYLFLTNIWPKFGRGSEMIKTPALIKRIFESPDGSQRRSYGTAFSADRSRSAPQAQPGRSGAWASGSSSAAGSLRTGWNSRGTGHRLGGD